MAKAGSELGTQRIDPDTGRKFYDLNKDPVVSPYTGKSYPSSYFESHPDLTAEEEEDSEDSKLKSSQEADLQATFARIDSLKEEHSDAFPDAYIDDMEDTVGRKEMAGVDAVTLLGDILYELQDKNESGLGDTIAARLERLTGQMNQLGDIERHIRGLNTQLIYITNILGGIAVLIAVGLWHFW